jgi:hypothetical protein
MLEKVLAVFVIGMKGNTLSTLPITMLLKTGLTIFCCPLILFLVVVMLTILFRLIHSSLFSTFHQHCYRLGVFCLDGEWSSAVSLPS